MKRALPWLLCLVCYSVSGPASAVNEAQIEAVKALGEKNGVALSCHHLDQTQKMKQAMVENLPKLKVLGDVFDQASNDSFLAFSAERELCPTKSEFRTEVDTAIQSLIKQFTKK